MKFFMPYAASDAMSEEAYQWTKKFVGEKTGLIVSERRIFSISYHHDGKDHYAEVGKEHDRIGEIVFAIFEAAPVRGTVVYLISSPSHGFRCGASIKVEEREVKDITDFEP